MKGTPPADEATARARSYALIAGLLRTGVTDALRPWVAAVPELAAHLSRDPDADAAEHHRLLALEVFPYEGVFLGPGPVRVGGPVTEAVQAAYAAAGWHPPEGASAADHIGDELAFMAAVTRHGAHDDARAFLDTHLLRWLPALSVAVERRGDGLYAAALRLAHTLALDHRALLGDPPPEPWALPATDALLDDATGLKRLSRRLLCPSDSGWFLTSGDIAEVAMALELPRGVGGRSQLLEVLLETARDYERIPALCAALDDVAQGWAAEWRRLDAMYSRWHRATVAAWLRRLDATRDALQTLARGAASVAERGPAPG